MFRQIASAVSRLYDTYMPAFWLRLKPRYQWAGGIAILVTVWVATGVFNSHAAPTEGAGMSTKPDDVARVRVTPAGRRRVTQNRSRRTAWLAARLRDLSPADVEKLDAAADVLERLVHERAPRESGSEEP